VHRARSRGEIRCADEEDIGAGYRSDAIRHGRSVASLRQSLCDCRNLVSLIIQEENFQAVGSSHNRNNSYFIKIALEIFELVCFKYGFQLNFDCEIYKKSKNQINIIELN